jgi:Transglycosylase SLT domain
MRRLVLHGLAGVGAAAFAVVAGVSALGGPTTTAVAGPPPAAVVAPGEFVPVQFTPADPVADAERAATAERDSREADRTRIAAATAKAAYERAANLGAQGAAIDQKSSEIKAAKKKAEAAEAAAAAAAEKARQAAIANQGYTPGTTDVHEIARQILENKFSYGDDQFACFSWIITHESNWNVHAQNPSGAYGLPQSLPGSKMASVGADWRDNPATQIIWGAQYMKSRYGSPCDAKSHWESAGNY